MVATRDWKWLVDFSAGNTQFVLFDWSNNSCGIGVKMNRSGLKEKSSFKINSLLNFLNRIGEALYKFI